MCGRIFCNGAKKGISLYAHVYALFKRERVGPRSVAQAQSEEIGAENDDSTEMVQESDEPQDVAEVAEEATDK